MLNYRRFVMLLLALLLALLAAGCGLANFTTPKPYKETQFLMDTIIEITAYGPGSEQAVKAAFGEFKRIHDLANQFDPNSQLAKINDQAGKSKVSVDPELVHLLKRAKDLSAQVEGAFDFSIGPLTELWGIGRKGDFVPTQAEINALLPLVDYRLVEVDEVHNTVYLPKPGMRLDLGGIAKGYATDKAVEKLKAMGVKSALVNAGGNVRVIGVKPDGAPWRIGIQHPRRSEDIIAKLALTDWDTLQTSGDYQRFIERNGVRYAHILDPRTGRQPQEVASVTVALNNSTDGDVLSTALFVMGVERGMQLLQKFPGVEAVFVTQDGRVVTTPGLAGKIEITGK